MPSLEEWEEEQQSAWLYRVMAERESDPAKQKLFRSLEGAAKKQAEIWLRRAGIEKGAAPSYRPNLRVRLVGALVRLLGPRPMRSALAAMKVRGLSAYSRGSAPLGHVMPTSLSDFGSRHRSVSGGGNLRAAVFGVSDGLVSNTSLILGVAGAGAEARTIVLTGCAGMLAGAFSMAAGEYVSVRSQRELFEYQIGLEKAELEAYPEEETEELALIYEARGLSLERAREVARELMKDHAHALDTLAREELGLNPEDLGSPWGAALWSFSSFGAGAVVPLVPYFVASGRDALGATVALATVCLFGVGGALSLFTGRNALWSGLRMVLIGGAAGLATWLIGSLFDASVA